MRRPLEIKFWEKVNKVAKNGCWEWTGSLNEHGYGGIRVEGRLWKAHRLSYLMLYGEFDLKLCVLHKCGNPPCVNPAHLFLGTIKDSSHDMMSKNRGFKPPVRLGEKNNQAKLTELAVLYIRMNHRKHPGGNRRELTSMFGVSTILIDMIVRRQIWKHV